MRSGILRFLALVLRMVVGQDNVFVYEKLQFDVKITGPPVFTTSGGKESCWVQGSARVSDSVDA